MVSVDQLDFFYLQLGLIYWSDKSAFILKYKLDFIYDFYRKVLQEKVNWGHTDIDIKYTCWHLHRNNYNDLC